MSRATEATLGVTMRLTVTPRSVATWRVLLAGTRCIPVVPSGQVYSSRGGRPLAARGVRGEPSARRKSDHDDDEKPSA